MNGWHKNLSLHVNDLVVIELGLEMLITLEWIVLLGWSNFDIDFLDNNRCSWRFSSHSMVCHGILPAPKVSEFVSSEIWNLFDSNWKNVDKMSQIRVFSFLFRFAYGNETQLNDHIIGDTISN